MKYLAFWAILLIFVIPKHIGYGKEKQLQYQEMSLFDDSFFEDVSSKGDELLPVEQNKETPVKKKSEKQFCFEKLEENARQKMEKAVRTGKAVNVSMPIDENSEFVARGNV